MLQTVVCPQKVKSPLTILVSDETFYWDVLNVYSVKTLNLNMKQSTNNGSVIWPSKL